MRNRLLFLALILSVLLLAMANILWGSVSIPAREVWQILCGRETGGHPAWTIIVREGRLPQMLTAMLSGASLGICGLLLQTAFRNPLAGPSILGIDAGANLGVASVLLLGGTFSIGTLSMGGHLLVVAAALSGALLTMLLLMALNRLLQNSVMLLITGVIISYITGSFIQLIN